MLVFLFVSLTNTPSFQYQQPVVQWVKEVTPNAITLDLDTFSEEMLVTQTCRLLQEATHFMVYFKSENEEVPLRAVQKIVEELIWKEKPGTVLLEGKHRRLQVMLPARPHLTFQTIDSVEDLKLFLEISLAT